MIRLVADEGIAGLEALPGDAIQLTRAAGREIAPPLLAEADALWVRSVTPVGAGLLRDSPLRFVGTATAGVEHIDRAYLHARSIAFAAAPGANANAVVEYVLAALLALDRPWADLERGEVLGIVGMGAVGRRLAAVARRLGWRVRCCDPYLGGRAGDALDGLVLEPFAALLGSRVLSLHPSLLVDGRWPSHHLIDESALAQLRAPQTLINTARGSVVDNRALWRRLQAPDAPTVALDVWEDEPRFHGRLLTCEALRIATPHIAGYSAPARLNATRMLYEAMLGAMPGAALGAGLRGAAAPRGGLAAAGECPPIAPAARPLTPAQLMRAVYDIARDDRRLRGLRHLEPGRRGAGFDGLRRNYPRRAELARSRPAPGGALTAAAERLCAALRL